MVKHMYVKTTNLPTGPYGTHIGPTKFSNMAMIWDLYNRAHIVQSIKSAEMLAQQNQLEKESNFKKLRNYFLDIKVASLSSLWQLEEDQQFLTKQHLIPQYNIYPLCPFLYQLLDPPLTKG